VGYFKDADDIYATIGSFLRSLGENPQFAPSLARADTVVEFSYREPEAKISVSLRPEQPIKVDLGPSEMSPEVLMDSSADVAHRFWLGRLNVSIAIARGEIRTEGPVAKILALMPLTEPIFPLYESQLRDAGREDLVTAGAQD
jgi:hypothetical protein